MVEELLLSPGDFSTTIGSSMFGGALGALILLGILAMIFVLAIVYVYFAWAWYSIARKLKHKTPWLAWIPFANIAMMLQLGGFHWAWVFLVLVPVLGWIALFILVVIATWRVFEKRSYPGWFSLSLVIPEVGLILYLVAIGFVAWKNKRK